MSTEYRNDVSGRLNVAVPTYAVVLSAENPGGVNTIWKPLSPVGSSSWKLSAPVAAFQPRSRPGSPKFGRSPATTSAPFGVTLGRSMIEPSKNVQRPSPAALTASRWPRLRER
jgi:hypothetical protein